jgi:hypothetical protein
MTVYQTHRKFVAAVIGAIVTIAATQGFTVDPELVAAVTTLITALVVYLVPNGPHVELYNQDLAPEDLA